MSGQAPNPILLVAGFGLWAVGFTALYAMLSIGCAAGWQQLGLGPTSIQRLMLVLVWAAHLGAIAALLVWLRRRFRAGDPGRATDRFLWIAAIACTGAALVAMIWTGIPVLALSTCT